MIELPCQLNTLQDKEVKCLPQTNFTLKYTDKLVHQMLQMESERNTKKHTPSAEDEDDETCAIMKTKNTIHKTLIVSFLKLKSMQ